MWKDFNGSTLRNFRKPKQCISSFTFTHELYFSSVGFHRVTVGLLPSTCLLWLILNITHLKETIFGRCFIEMSILVGCSVYPPSTHCLTVAKVKVWAQYCSKCCPLKCLGCWAYSIIIPMQRDHCRLEAFFQSNFFCSGITSGLAVYYDQCLNAVHYVLRVIIARGKWIVVEDKHVAV